MARGRMEIEGSRGRYVRGGAAGRLIRLGQARETSLGRLELLPGAPDVDALDPERAWWTERSRGYEMNGKAVNRGMPCE